ncbi:MAG: WbuC family cupin fold metalloprotein [Victivallaceae bacterium]
MKIVSKELLADLTTKARESVRKRAHHNLHESLDEDIHRLCIAAEPGSYIRPHRHFSNNKWELFIILKGKVAILTFDANGAVLDRIEMVAGDAPCAVEYSSDAWHTFVALESGTVAMEVKRGPYQAPTADDWAGWAPAEGEVNVPEFEQWFCRAQPGESFNQQN